MIGSAQLLAGLLVLSMQQQGAPPASVPEPVAEPEAPMGWPSATAPPRTLSFSCGIASSFMAAIATAANASLTSKRSTS